MKRFIRIDLEYNSDKDPLNDHSFAITDNIKRILREDMPYVRIIFSRNSSNIEELDHKVVKK